MRRLIILILSMGMVSGPSFGASGWVQGAVTFEQPVRSEKTILGGESVWRCESATCRGRAPDHFKSTQHYCRELARWGGAIVSFRAGTIMFDAEALRNCNGGR